MVQLIRVTDGLPEGFEGLRAAADAEGFGAMSRLAREWAETPELFVCLLAAPAPERLLAIGGLTAEPEPKGEPAMRIRRPYVHPDARRRGVGTVLINALVQEALDSVRLVTMHGPDTLSPAFWESLGFARVQDQPWTHEFRG